MEEKLTVSIVTFFTNFSLLNETIRSITNDLNNAYFVIVDNSQSSEYFNKLREFRFDAEKIAIINTSSNKGYGYGHNFAQKYTPDSLYHLVVNPDITVHAGSLKKMIEYMEKENNISLLFPKILNVDGSLQYLNTREPTLLNLMLNRFPLKHFKEFSFLTNQLNNLFLNDNDYIKKLIAKGFAFIDKSKFIKSILINRATS